MELSMLPDKIEAKSRGSCAPMRGTRAYNHLLEDLLHALCL